MSTVLAARRSETADPPKRWTTAEFDRMIGQGLIEEGCDTYLWEGQIVEPMPEYQPHINAVANLLALLLSRLSAADWSVGLSAPLDLEDGTKPQPDLLVIKWPRSRFRVAPPSASDVALVVEISVSTYPRDSGERYRKYAAFGIEPYWIVNVPERRVEVYEVPHVTADGTSTYQKRTDFGLDQTIPVELTRPGAAVALEVAVIDILRDSLERAEDQAE
ncbi:MAG: Uma2 family endonuclease [Planctomycetia bacterium]|nr:Uma2 family endonuclease [Planctomycetia bacterium]